MKRFFALVLVLVMVTIVSIPALADGVVLNNNVNIPDGEMLYRFNGEMYVPIGTYSTDGSIDNTEEFTDETNNDDESSDLGYVEFSLDNGKSWKRAEEWDDDYGNRIWFSCAKALFPKSTWNTEFSDAQKKKFETTWIKVRVLVPDGTFSRVYCHDWKQSGTTYENGFVMELDPGFYEFVIKNGEIQNWEIGAGGAAVDLDRIWENIRNGNINHERQLDLAGITINLASELPTDLNADTTVGPTAN